MKTTYNWQVAATALLWLMLLGGGLSFVLFVIHAKREERAEREANQRRALGNKGRAR